eukprot:COSAG02_NODE_7475_length_2995_cov_3.665401_1_plen_565_part_00
MFRQTVNAIRFLGATQPTEREREEMDVKEVVPAVLAVGSAVMCFAAKRSMGGGPVAVGPGEQEPSPDATTVCDIGVFGMGVMGQNLALNAADSGFTVGAYNRADEFQARIQGALDRAKAEGRKDGGEMKLHAFFELEPFVRSLKQPRRILLSIPAGKPVEMTLEALRPLLGKDDIVIDGGNEHFTETVRRENETHFHFCGMGISGGADGARHGPSMMPGGSKFAYAALQPIFQAMCAKVNGESCVTHVGPDGAGHYSKMVHNGIEYADMQFIAECYDVMKNVCGFSNDQIADVYEEWNDSPLESFLIEATAAVMRKKDNQVDSGGVSGGSEYLIDKILDQAGSKGTGKWTVQLAADSGIAVPSCSAALEARFISAQKPLRTQCEKVFPTPAQPKLSQAECNELMTKMQNGLLCAKILAYAQGFLLLGTMSEERGWDLQLGELARIWRGGCIIRARFLDTIIAAYKNNPSLASLMLDPPTQAMLEQHIGDLRAVVSTSIARGIPTPALTGALNYFDGMRRARGSANVIQAQRDYFGAHTFKRTDKPGTFHADWTQQGLMRSSSGR